tara:strand:- start:566 stop:799 length:234 start_codon:yes stop_codon:yes gene_type:complete
MKKNYYVYTLVLRQKQRKNMTKNYFYQVKLVQNSYLLWYDFFAYFIFGNLANAVKRNGFLQIINPFINKNLYYENKF